jgi:hypothetical protein
VIELADAISRKVRFELLGVHDFEYPPGNPMCCNDRRFGLDVYGAR